MSPGTDEAGVSSFISHPRAFTPVVPVPLRSDRTDVHAWPAGLRGEIKEEASAAGGGRGTFARKVCRSRPAPSGQSQANDQATSSRRPRSRPKNHHFWSCSAALDVADQATAFGHLLVAERVFLALVGIAPLLEDKAHRRTDQLETLA